ncbi:MAG TPA: NAD(P)H-hydrate epimerase, partial [Chitinophagaceae bacterium]
MKIFSALQIREADAYTIAHEPIEGIELMERAANQCATWIENRYPGDKSFSIFCGMGNNGGDGLAIARLLYQAGHQVSAYIVFYGKDFSPDSLANKTRLEHLFRFPLHAIHDREDFPVTLPEDTIIIDALFGTGLTRPLTGLAAAVVEKINALHRHHPVIAIDLPSGMFADSTAKGSLSVQADFTLSFQFYKLSFLMPENANLAGEVIILPIGLHADYIRDTATLNQIVDEDMLKSIFKKRSLFS